MEDFETTLRRYDELAARVDPEEEPYKSKYEGRALLEAFLAKHSKSGSGEQSPSGRLQQEDAVAVISGRLGVNLLQCEETTPAEKPLQLCLARATTSAAAVDAATKGESVLPSLQPQDAIRMIHAGLEAANHLALLYSGWDMHAKALAALEQGRSLYRRARRIIAGDVGGGSAAAAAVAAAQIAGLDALFTHTTFYLAQVHGHLGHSVDTHRYIEVTLSRQLDEQRAAAVAAAAASGFTSAAAAAAAAATASTDSSAAAAAAQDAASAAKTAAVSAASASVPPPSAAAPPPAAGSAEAAASAGSAVSAPAASSTAPAASPAAVAAPAPAPLFAVDRHEWVRNALRLSGLYCGRLQWVAAAHCLAAADVVLHQAIAAAAAAASSAAPSAAAIDGAGAAASSAAPAAPAAAADACSPAAMDAARVPDALQRLYAEVATHWARLYVDILAAARECAEARAEAAAGAEGRASGGGAGSAAGAKGKGTAGEDTSEWERAWDRHWASKGSADASSAGAGAAGAGAGSAAGSGGDDAADPFSTMPTPPKFPATAASTSAGAGAGAASDAESDEALLSELPRRNSGATAGASSSPSSSPTGPSSSKQQEQRPAGGPFSAFLLREAPGVKPSAYTSYGPLHVGSATTAAAATTAASPAGGAGAAGSGSSASASASSPSAATEPAVPPCPGLCLSGLRRVPLPSAIAAGGFEAAREVFRAANSACSRALQYLKLDGFVSDHVEVLQLLCRAYKYVST